MKYRNDQRESKEFKADLAQLNEALEGGYNAAGPHTFEKKENLAERNSLKTRCYYGLWHWKIVLVEIIVLFLA